MKNFKNLLFAALFLIAATVIGQTKISGTIVDETNEGLPGASVVIKGTTNGTETDFNGKFMLTASTESGTIVVSYLGFKTMEFAFTSAGDLGKIKLEEDGNILEEVVLRGIVDIAKDRQTPVAKSTIKAAEIQDRLGSQEFPELLNNTPSVYATKSGGGFGDARITIRGFAQENIAVLINGVPVNDMENGRVYWSNWAGLADVTTAMQVQRGLGSSKLAISSVGGTINIVTKTTDLKEGGSIVSSVGNDGYFKNLASYNTGKNENGFDASFLMSRTAANGYVDGTKFEGFNYFIGLGWDKGDHNFQFMLTGAPQTHNQRTTSFYNMADIGDYLKYGKKYNYNHGYLNGEEFNWRQNFYHKPITSFNWSWDINETSSLTTSAYVSFGRGGGTGDIGRMGGNFASSSRFRNPDTGLVEWDEIVKANSGLGGNFSSGYSYTNPADPSTGLQIVNDDELRDSDMPNGLERRNGMIRRASVNSHNWVGVLSNYSTEINDNLTFDVGIDLRSYTGLHYRRVDNLLGADGYRDNDDINNPLNVQSTEYSSDLAQQWNVFRSTEDEQKIAYNNDGKVRWAGAFSQLEYVSDDISAFVQVGISQQGFKRIDYFNYLDSDPERETGWENFLGGNVKGGVNWNIDENHNVFVNMGDYSKQPFIDAVFLNNQNVVNSNPRNEKVAGFELGYGYTSEKFKANLNVYRTEWKDRFKSVGYRDGDIRGTADLQGIKQLHTGVELDFTYDITDNFRFLGMASLGDWEYAGNVSGTAFDQDLQAVGTVNLYLDGVKVGNSAQTTARLGFDWEVTDNFKIDYSHRYAAELYADINTADFDSVDNDGSLQLPSYFLGDVGMSYKFDFRDNSDLKLRLNINNVGNTEYISESLTNNFVEPGDDSYRGINTNNKAFFGFGTTWNFTVRYNF
ncbi:MAG: carboxypeptidase-like regulatory domain-containing protein [Flavobacteriaceae bacterium]|nr:carboxypeptidase-like regulatory domain-containing protein [Flavobacteriaceae bacterium]